MTLNLLEAVKDIFTPDKIRAAASSLGESERGISTAISAAAPLALQGIISKATSGDDGASSILQAAKIAGSSGILDNLGNIFGSGGLSSITSSGADVVKRLLGDKTESIISSISSFAGIKGSSASSLIGTVSSVILGLLGKHAAGDNLTPAGLSNLLSSQKASVTAALPAGLNLGSFAHTSAHTSAYTVEKTETNRRWLMPLLLAIAVIILVWILSRSCNKDATTVAPVDTVTVNTPVTAGPESIKVKLPDGTELDAYKGGIEDMLVAYLNSEDPADSISSSRWFDFDNLNFKTGSADLTAESMKQVQNISAILKAYPKVNLKIGGYTDKTGNEDNNKKLSQLRAQAVVDALKNTGAAESQLAGAEGYGSQFAKAAADAPDEQRKLDRRISVSVRKK